MGNFCCVERERFADNLIEEFIRAPCFAKDAAARTARRKLIGVGSDVQQMLIGDAIGDAFGFVIEMQDASWIRERVTNFIEYPSSAGARDLHNIVPGFYSDDCEMTVALMKGLVADGVGIDAAGMLRFWKDEWDLSATRPLPALQGEGRRGHGSIKKYWRGEMTLEEVQQMQAKKVVPGNAPPMRSLALGFVADASARERLCTINADATHPHPKTRAASFLVATACRFLVVEKRAKDKVLVESRQALENSALKEQDTLEHLKKLEKLPDYHDYGERLRNMPDDVHALICGPQPCPEMLHHKVGEPGDWESGRRMHGIGSDAMRTAGAVLYLVQHCTTPVDLLMGSVDIGGDVDSIAALSLGLLGGSSGLRFGEVGGLSWALLEDLEGVEYLSMHANSFQNWVAATQRS